MLKHPTGICIDCNDGKQKTLIAGRCRERHYQIYRARVNAELKKETSPEKTPPKRSYSSFYKRQRPKMTGVCANCGGASEKYSEKYWKWGICHVLPKEHFVSIANCDDNWWEACIRCHTIYDRNWMTAQKMPVFRLVLLKFVLFMSRISSGERKRIPECFLIDQATAQDSPQESNSKHNDVYDLLADNHVQDIQDKQHKKEDGKDGK